MKKLVVALLILTLLLTGCETTGSASGITNNCRSSNATGTCTLTIGSMQGTYSRRIENDSFRSSHNHTQVNAVITAGSGDLQVYVVDGEGNETSVEVKAGQSAELNGLADISGTNPRHFTIYFKAVGESAENVQAEINYQAQ